MKNNTIKSTSINSMMIASISGLSFIIGLFFVLLTGANYWGDHLKKQMNIYVYLDDSLTINEINATILLMKRSNYVNSKDVQFVSKEKTAREFLASSHENYEELLGDVNPFKNLVILGIQDSVKSNLKLNQLVTKFKSINGVYDVSYPTNFLLTLSPKIKVITSIISILSLLLIFWIYLQLSNYVRLNIHANRLLIKSMQLLGSTNGFILKPYILNALLIGVIGSIIGYFLINILLYFVTMQIPEIQSIYLEISNQIQLFSANIIFCVLFCLISTIIAVNKYLKTSHINLI